MDKKVENSLKKVIEQSLKIEDDVQKMTSQLIMTGLKIVKSAGIKSPDATIIAIAINLAMQLQAEKNNTVGKFAEKMSKQLEKDLADDSDSEEDVIDLL